MSTWQKSLGGNLMTIATKTRNVAGWAILALVIAGCSGGGEAGEGANAPVELNEAGFISVPESSDDPGYCGYLPLGVDDEGIPIVQEERYRYSVMDRLLAEDADLQRAVGLPEVTTCEQARRFVSINNDYREQHPPTAEDKAAMLADIPIADPEPPKAPVEKVFGGTPTPIKEVVRFAFQRNTNGQLRSRNCTAVRLSGTLFLTAAHCLLLNDGPRSKSADPFVSFPVATLTHIVDSDARGELYPADKTQCTGLKPGERCHRLQMDGYLNPNFVGSLDRINDVAVLHVRHESQSGLRNAASAISDFQTNIGWISTNTPKVGENVSGVGWGPNGANDKSVPMNQWQMRTATTVPVHAVDPSPGSKAQGFYQGMWFNTTAAAGAQLCAGDSGGPAYNDYQQVMGVLSLLDKSDAAHCAPIGATQEYSRTDWQIFGFIRNAVRVMQVASDTTLCTCVLVPASSGSGPEEPGAYMRCNEGCKDPSSWTP